MLLSITPKYFLHFYRFLKFLTIRFLSLYRFFPNLPIVLSFIWLVQTILKTIGKFFLQYIALGRDKSVTWWPNTFFFHAPSFSFLNEAIFCSLKQALPPQLFYFLLICLRLETVNVSDKIPK